MTRIFGITSAFAECEDCGWKTESYKNAQAIAAIHARKYGHVVNVEVVMSGQYNGRQNADGTWVSK